MIDKYIKNITNNNRVIQFYQIAQNNIRRKFIFIHIIIFSPLTIILFCN